VKFRFLCLSPLGLATKDRSQNNATFKYVLAVYLLKKTVFNISGHFKGDIPVKDAPVRREHSFVESSWNINQNYTLFHFYITKTKTLNIWFIV